MRYEILATRLTAIPLNMPRANGREIADVTSTPLPPFYLDADDEVGARSAASAVLGYTGTFHVDVRVADLPTAPTYHPDETFLASQRRRFSASVRRFVELQKLPMGVRTVLNQEGAQLIRTIIAITGGAAFAELGATMFAREREQRGLCAYHPLGDDRPIVDLESGMCAGCMGDLKQKKEQPS
jgi:hypothetical protein